MDGVPVVGAVCTVGGHEQNWFVLPSAVGDRVTARLVFGGTTTDAQLFLYSTSNGGNVPATITAGTPNVAEISVTKTVKEMLYLVAYGWNDRAYAYELTASAEPPCTDDARERGLADLRATDLRHPDHRRPDLPGDRRLVLDRGRGGGRHRPRPHPRGER